MKHACSRWALRLLAAVLLLTLASPAWADSVVVVAPFTGDKKSQLHEHVSKAMVSGGVLLGNGDVSPAADASDARFQAVATENNIHAFILGHTVMSQKGWTLKLTVRNGKDGSILGSKSVKASWLPGLLKKIESGAHKAVAPLLAKGQAPKGAGAAVAVAAGGEVLDADAPAGQEVIDADEQEEEEEDEEDAGQADEAEEVEETDADLKPTPFEIGVGFGLLMRNHAGNDDPYGTFRDQAHSGTMLAFGFSGGLYPGVLFTDGFLGNLGLIASFENSFLGQVPVNGQNIDTTSTEFSVGGRMRVPFGRQEMGLSAAFLSHAFTFAFAGPERIVPDVHYTVARIGGDARFRFLGPWGVKLQGGYRIVADPGRSDTQIGSPVRACINPDATGTCSYFRRYGFEDATAGGFDLALDAQYWFFDKFAITAGVAFRHYYFDFHFDEDKQEQLGLMTPPDILQVVGGATDQYLLFRIGAELRL